MEVKLVSAKWCEQCPNMKATLDNLGISYNVVDIDTDDGSAYAQAKRIRGLPAVVFTTDKSEVVVIGVKNKSYIEQVIEGLN